jgi:hypothetical protein
MQEGPVRLGVGYWAYTTVTFSSVLPFIYLLCLNRLFSDDTQNHQNDGFNERMNSNIEFELYPLIYPAQLLGTPSNKVANHPIAHGVYLRRSND